MCQRFNRRCITALCLFCGVDLAPDYSFPYAPRFLKGVKVRKRCILLYRLLLCGQLLCFGLDNIIREYSRLTSNIMSSTEFIQIIFGAFYPLVLAQAMSCLWTNQDFLKEVLRQKVRTHTPCPNHAKQLGYLLCWALFTAHDAFTALSATNPQRLRNYSVLWDAAPWCGILSKQSQYLVFILLFECQAVLMRGLDKFNFAVGRSSQFEILNEKLALRSVTSKVNRTFSSTLAMLYVKVVLLLYIFLSHSLISPSHKTFAALTALGPALQILMLYDLACGGSEIIRRCRQTASKALLLNPQLVRDYEPDSWSRLLQIISFDEHQDSLMVSDCFTFTKGSLFSYMALVVTCIAVILQFDYHVLQKLDDDKILFRLRMAQGSNATFTRFFMR